MINWDDFEKIWARTSPLTPYQFSDSNYEQGWNFVGATPPSRQMWDYIQKQNDEKFKYLRDNFGTPNMVTSSSQMTDTEKVYVYMGSEAGWNNGHWYYYDEGTSSWADGGVYNSVAFVTDTTLSIAGQPADAKATGDALALKSDLAGCTFTGNVGINADLSVTGDATIGTDLSVTGVSTLTGNVSAGADVTVVGDVSSANLTTSADATIGGDLSVTGTSTLAGNITTSGDISADNISATTNGTIGGNLSVTGTSTLTGNINAGADITAVGDVSADNLTTTTNATVGGSLSVAGTSTLTGNVTTNGNISAVGDISSANLTTTNATIGGNATVTGDVSCANLTTSADASVGGDLTVTGDSTLADTTVNGLVVNNDLSVAGDSSLTNLSVSGTTALAGTSTAPTPSADDNSTKIATTEYVQTEIKPIEVNADIVNKRVTNIEKLLQGNLYDYQTDTDSKYTKTVLAGAMPYASLDSIGGKTLVWNQLFPLLTATSYTYRKNIASIDFVDGVCSFTVNAKGGWFGKTSNSFPLKAGHKYFFRTDVKGYAGASINVYMTAGLYTETKTFTSSEWKTYSTIISIGSDVTPSTSFSCTDLTDSDWQEIQTKNVMCVDLTLLCGAGNEPTTVDEFLAMYPSYIATNQGTLLSAGVTEVVSKGKNLWKMQMAGYGSNFYNIAVGSTLSFNGSSVPITDNGDGSFTFTCTGSWQGAFFLMPIDVAKEHRLHFGVSGSNLRMSWYMLDKDYKVLYVLPYTANTTINSLVGGAETSHPTTKYICVTVGTNTANTTLTLTQPMLELGSTASSYVPYVEYTYPIPAEIQALEGYGWSAGSVSNYIDYERKIFVQCVDMVDLGTLSWSKTGSNNIFYANVTDKANNTELVCDGYAYMGNFISANDANVNLSDKGIGGFSGTSTNHWIYIKDSAYASSTTAQFTTAVSGINMYFVLATPIETDISAYLTDDNLISVESGGTLTFPNSNGTDYQIPVPSAETYMVDLQSALGE